MSWSDRLTNNDMHRIENRRIYKDVMYGELATGKRVSGRPRLRYLTSTSAT
ncbi:hypothetical protein DPMN_087746 [Dreissena polymorpha]|uniref:Uncharacterized protein n=1 Tax=Dreissena polymorpha TaxID=45954 RepID=A0A9D4KST8_DREPO|nr:hypothetical protein DPMN_087687 [Dreissena polymorpha]KAH3845465.1 hypothetical protein DPMN_087746 [Dreissena polymorpha]